MRLSLLIFLLIVAVSVASAQRVPSDCSGQDSVERHYRADAARMARTVLSKRDSHFSDDSITIPRSLQDTMLGVLMAVFNSGLPAADSAVGHIWVESHYLSYYGVTHIHCFDSTTLQQIAIECDTSIAWQARLAARSLPTGNSRIDSLFDLYGLTFRDPNSYSQYVTLLCKEYCNTIALAKEWNHRAASATMATGGTLLGDGSYMVAVESDSGWGVRYHWGLGDCPSGCTSWYDWTFSVFPDCSVRPIGSGGTVYFDDVRTEPIAHTRLLVYPDPAHDRIMVNTTEVKRLECVAVSGITVRSLQCASQTTQFDLEGLSPGRYTLRAIGLHGEVRTANIVKQ